MVYSLFHLCVVAGLIITGSANTIITKFMMKIHSVGVDGIEHTFEHPIFHTTTMFVGEMFCFIFFYSTLYYYKKKEKDESTNPITKGSRKFNPLLITVPAIFDMTATAFNQTGLILTYASSYQIFRSSVVIFTAILDRIFLKTAITIVKVVGMALVIIGLTLVGVGDYLLEDETMTDNDTHSPIGKVVIGDLLVITGEFCHASQVVYEEKILTSLDIPPMLCVGWEGFYGTLVTTLLMIPSYFIIVGRWSTLPKQNLDDGIDAILQLKNSLAMSSLLVSVMVSIAFFNFFILIITKELNAITSMVFDSLRTSIVWMFGLIVFNQKFHYIQFIGFIVQLVGTLVYNNAFSKENIEFFKSKLRKKKEIEEGQEGDKSQKTD